MHITLFLVLLASVHASQLWGHGKLRAGVGRPAHFSSREQKPNGQITLLSECEKTKPEQSKIHSEQQRTESLCTAMELTSECCDVLTLMETTPEDSRPAGPFNQRLPTASSSILHCGNILARRSRTHFLSRPPSRIRARNTASPGPLLLATPQPPQQTCAQSTAPSAGNSYMY
ncbi:hypothetical protein PSACC_03135 [Paramicrosporidium saccamoebae]|uniref:Uncharacterized protein n=1 Tax=Paramicrosporidium saccamoebae TaxID=1246581 RepID=A0A2H9TH70_9FUNG|nr:hypothetical protein PSACC_03135 [Paramicrosporidium saccamoebae]